MYKGQGIFDFHISLFSHTILGYQKNKKAISKRKHFTSFFSEQCKRAFFKKKDCSCYFCRRSVKSYYICTASLPCYYNSSFSSFKGFCKHLKSFHNFKLPLYKPAKASRIARRYYIRIEIVNPSPMEPLFKKILTLNPQGRGSKNHFICRTIVTTEEGSNFCGVKLNTFKSMVRHLQKNHSIMIPNEIICFQCEALFSSVSQLIDHYR